MYHKTQQMSCLLMQIHASQDYVTLSKENTQKSVLPRKRGLLDYGAIVGQAKIPNTL